VARHQSFFLAIPLWRHDCCAGVAGCSGYAPEFIGDEPSGTLQKSNVAMEHVQFLVDFFQLKTSISSILIRGFNGYVGLQRRLISGFHAKSIVMAIRPSPPQKLQ